MSITLSDVLTNVIANGISGILTGIVGGCVMLFAERGVSYTSRKAKGTARFTLSLLLSFGIILSPSKMDDIRGVSNLAASVPAVVTANVVVRSKTKNRDRQKAEMKERIRQAQIPSPEEIDRATSFPNAPATPSRFSSRQPISTTQYLNPLFSSKRRYRGASTLRQSTPKISSLFKRLT